MKCELCNDRGFTEQNHGLVQVQCKCVKGTEAGKLYAPELKTEYGKGKELIVEPAELMTAEALNDTPSGTGQDNSASGAKDTSKPVKPRKRKTKKPPKTRSR